MAKIKKPIAAILVRESRDSQDPDSQINLCLRNAERFGYYVPNEYQYVEHATGMDAGVDRFSVVQLKDAIVNKGNIKAVFVSELTRITRDTFHLVDEIKWFCDHKVPIYIDDYDEWTGEIKDNGDFEIDTETRDHILHTASYGEREWFKIRKRITRGRKRSSWKGLSIGIISDGYKVEIINKEKHIVIDTELEDGTLTGRAKLIKDIFDMYTIKRYSTDKIAGILNSNGVPTFSALEAQRNDNNKNVKKTIKIKGIDAEKRKVDILWGGSTICNILKNRWYIGERTVTWKFDEEIPRVEKHEHKPIVSVEQFEEAQKILVSNKKEISKRRDNTYPLSRIFYCGKCGSLMLGHKVRINSTYYCSSLEKGTKCGAEGICKQNVDAIVWDFIKSIQTWLLYYKNKNEDNLYSVFALSKVDKDALLAENELLIKEITEIEDKLDKCRKQIVGFKSFILTSDDKAMIPYYEEEIGKIEKTIIQKTKELTNKKATLKANKKLLQEDSSIDNSLGKRIEEISNNKDINAVSSIIHQLVKKVVLYNLFNSYKLIEIEIAYNKKYYAIYNSRKFKGKYIRLLFDNNDLKYDPQNNRFSTGFALGWCTFQIGIGDNVRTRIDLRAIDEKTFNENYKYWYDNNVPYLKKEFSPEELIALLDYKKGLYEYPIVRIEKEPTDEEYQSWKADYKRWSKERDIKRTEKRRAKKAKKENDNNE